MFACLVPIVTHTLTPRLLYRSSDAAYPGHNTASYPALWHLCDLLSTCTSNPCSLTPVEHLISAHACSGSFGSCSLGLPFGDLVSNLSNRTPPVPGRPTFKTRVGLPSPFASPKPPTSSPWHLPDPQLASRLHFASSRLNSSARLISQLPQFVISALERQPINHHHESLRRNGWRGA
jgi:hypothetical protein